MLLEQAKQLAEKNNVRLSKFPEVRKHILLAAQLGHQNLIIETTESSRNRILNRLKKEGFDVMINRHSLHPVIEIYWN